MEELQEIERELGMKYAIYAQHSRGPDEELVSPGTKDAILYSALGSCAGL